ncbi:glycosyltransferase family 2 protein [Acinetobacter sp. BSP-28]|uniref:glycosyltransferase family 2 protein n=1 Tax=Acinetobacter sp. BSP-28 TaxID=3344661 RepID=UPI00376FA858
MNVLILAAGHTALQKHDENYPLSLAEFDGVPLIQKLIEQCVSIGSKVNFIIALRETDVRDYYLDNIVRLLSSSAEVLKVSNNTKGAACTALLAVPYIDNSDELLILNGNELIDIDFALPLQNFRQRNLDAGVVSFNSIHPRYSYVKIQDELVVEAAEKRPISRHATVGFYWFARGSMFVKAAKNMIRKDASVNGIFYICPSLNELVLEQYRIGIFTIATELYHPIKNERQLEQLEAVIERRK